MIKKVILVVLVITLVIPAKSQHFVGKSKVQVEKEMKTLLPEFVIDNSSVNRTYKYLKYINKITEQTMLIFLSENDICTSTKVVSDYSNLLQVKKDLNNSYKSTGKDTWKYSIDGVKYVVKLKREEWYFTVFTTKDD